MTLPMVTPITAQALSPGASAWDLVPVLAAVIVPVVGLTVALMRYQHLDSTKTRDLIERTATETAKAFEKQFEQHRSETNKQSEQHRSETDKQFEQVHEQFDMLRSEVRQNGDRLNDARERLARIEGRLDAVRPLPDDNDGENSRNAA